MRINRIPNLHTIDLSNNPSQTRDPMWGVAIFRHDFQMIVDQGRGMASRPRSSFFQKNTISDATEVTGSRL